VSSLRPLTTYLCASLVLLLPLTQTGFLPSLPLILYGLAVVVLLSHGNDVVQPDFLDGHLAWLLSHGQSPSRYFLNQLGRSLLAGALPLTGAFSSLCLGAYPGSTVLILAGSFLVTCVTLLCWGILFALAQGQQNQSLMGIVLAPLAIPNLLIAESLLSSGIATEAIYYLGMQGGLMLISIGLSTGLAPLVIQNLDW
jgi:hypothetical protein